MTGARWTPKAQADLVNVEDYYGPLDQNFVDELGRKAFAAAQFLADHPHVGSPFGAGTRMWRVRGTKYLLIYRVVRSGIQILRVRHGHENWRTEF